MWAANYLLITHLMQIYGLINELMNVNEFQSVLLLTFRFLFPIRCSGELRRTYSCEYLFFVYSLIILI